MKKEKTARRRTAAVEVGDVLVIGAGISGCATALAAAEAGRAVTLVSKGEGPEESATWRAQGGIVYQGADDSDELLIRDIVEAGARIGHPAAVHFLVSQGKRAVQEILIERLKIPFDGAGQRHLHFTEEGAHSRPRVIHVKDYTGRAILAAFLSCLAQHPRVRFLRGCTAVDLITPAHHSRRPLDLYRPMGVAGAYLFHQRSGAVIPHLAQETVLASGGVGKLFLHTTNPWSARGDGIAMAYRAGARIMNMEYIQFHPTALYHPQAHRFLISESLRGEGAVLRNARGQRFMGRYDRRQELAPRDVVARAIHQEMMESESECVYLDLTHRRAAWIERRFPQILQECLKYGLDLRRQPLPVVPAAHYLCGGVAADLCGKTNIAGLRAVGETACTGLHGANRLASTSLLEGLVFGLAAGRDLGANLGALLLSPRDVLPWEYGRQVPDPALIKQDWSTLRQTMWNYVGLVRTERRLDRAWRIVSGLKDAIDLFYRGAALHDHLIGLRHGVLCASLIIHAARLNRTSRGCHYRLD